MNQTLSEKKTLRVLFDSQRSFNDYDIPSPSVQRIWGAEVDVQLASQLASQPCRAADLLLLGFTEFVILHQNSSVALVYVTCSSFSRSTPMIRSYTCAT